MTRSRSVQSAPARPSLARLALGVVALLFAALPLLAPTAADAQKPVRAVLFYSPQCPHCHVVVEEHLPPLMEQYGDALQILLVNVDTPEGQSLYRETVRRFSIPDSRLGVPALFAGNRQLVGSGEIPGIFPGMVAAAVDDEGMDWPPLPGLEDYLAADGGLVPGATDSEALTLLRGGGSAVVAGGSSGWTGRFMADPLGNTVATGVLLLMVGALVHSVRTLRTAAASSAGAGWPSWAIPALALVGLGIAGYLAFVETTGADAVCGPVGDCNRVQQSEWATLGGVPIGVLGVLGYLAVGLAGLLRSVDRSRARTWATLTWGLAVVGVLFSAYLTFLEPFVIGATCVWCVTSALVMTAILVGATPDAARARV